jgi:hypothetical protein
MRETLWGWKEAIRDMGKATGADLVVLDREMNLSPKGGV